MEDDGHPPAPWSLTVSATVSLLTVPRRGLPAAARPVMPAGCRPVVLAGRLLTGVGLSRYGPAGDLSYNELVVAVLGRCGLRPVVTVTQIWVDSRASRDGARALWGIPKELAASAPAADPRGAPVARVRTRAGRTLPLGVPLRFTTAQHLDGADHRARHRLEARLAPGRASWDFAPAGPLGHLARLRPLLTLRLDGSLLFGAGATGGATSRRDAARDRNRG